MAIQIYNKSALRVNVGLGVVVVGWGSCYQDSSGGEVGGVGEAVDGSSQDLEQVVGAVDAAVGRAVGVVPGEYLVGPGNDGVNDFVELGEFAGGLEVAEPAEHMAGVGQTGLH